LNINEFSWPLRVYIEDTDAGGIVYYVNYLKYMERARTEFLRYLGHDHATLMANGIMFVIASAQIDYVKPARLDNELLATVSVGTLKKSHLTFRQQITSAANGELFASADIKSACVKRDTVRPCAIPADMAASLAKYTI